MSGTPKKTCFIISPIGAEASETRKLADDFLELLVEPALARYGFDVIRGDQLANSNAITSDIIRLVQESDLCIIDLTASNPNVFYECGRRHETGKPFIQMIRKGDDKAIPFDVAGIRTVTYDVTSPRTVLDSQRKLQEVVDNFLSTGFEAGTSGESLSSIAQALERIERKIGALFTAPRGGAVGPGDTEDSSDEEESDFGSSVRELSVSPRQSYVMALKRGNIDKALAILPKLEKITDKKEYVAALALALSVGSARAFEMMDQIYHDLIKDPKQVAEYDEVMQGIAQAYINYFTNTGEVSKGLTTLETVSNAVIASDAFTRETKAFTVNKVGMLAWNARDHQRCISATKLALDLNPDPSYAYNLALVHDQIGNKDELKKALDILSQFPEIDGDHKRLLRRHGYRL
jgi:tetratricopeptide (TPR) repeat protein